MYIISQPFRKLKVDAMIVELDGRKDGNAIQSVLGEMTGARTASLSKTLTSFILFSCSIVFLAGASSVYQW